MVVDRFTKMEKITKYFELNSLKKKIYFGEKNFYIYSLLNLNILSL